MSSGVLSAAVLCVCAGVLHGSQPARRPIGRAEQALAAKILKDTGAAGGLVVHVGCGDGKLTAALRADDCYLVHGLDADEADIEKARAHIRATGLYGKVSVQQWTHQRLPYTDNLVNLLVAEDLGKVPMREVLRVLVPDGVAYVKQGGKWTKTVKPRPKEIDEWTHFLHDADGNAVAKDALVGPPRHMQWVGGPRWARSHEHLASVSAVVSAAGRIFYIVDEGPTASVTLPPKWSLVARDAFNGVLLWKRPIASWAAHLRGFRSGPPRLPRRLIAVGDKVYVTLGLDAPLTAVDAATGKILSTYEQTRRTEEVIHSGGLLIVAADTTAAKKPERAAEERRGRPPAPDNKSVIALRPETGKVLWRKKTKRLAPLTLAADGKRVFYKDGEKVLCAELKTGRELWQSQPIPEPLLKGRSRPMALASWYSPTLVAYREVVLFADGQILAGLSAKTGKRLWADKSNVGFHSPPDVLVAGGLVWTAKIASARDPGFAAARDPTTGKVKKELAPDRAYGMPHHRCYRNKATDRYILAGRAGIEFVDVRSGKVLVHHWVRGTCQYGVLPCNGLVYAPPHSCACFIRAKLSGFNALAAERRPARARPDGAGGYRLERGPAYDEVPAGSATGSGPNDWPTYRHDPARSGATKSAVPAALKRAWQADLGGRLTSPVIADGKVFVASIDAHTVHAMDAGGGKMLWRYTAGGRVDSPPTVCKGLVLFGSADGWVYCVRASDGKLAWRVRGAREERRVVAYGQLESAWPVHGSVLVQNDVVCFAAGRSSFLDGGIWLYRLDLKTGKKLSETRVYSPDPKTGRQPKVIGGFEIPGALPDVLSSDGKSIYMRHVRFDRQGARQERAGRHLFSPTGFLDGSWWHRSYWIYGEKFNAGWSGWWRVGNRIPSGRILVFDSSSVYGFGRNSYPGSTPLWGRGEKYHLFAAPVDKVDGAKPRAARQPAKQAGKKPTAKKQPAKTKRAKRPPVKSTVKYRWTRDVPLVVRAMVLAGKTLFVAGPAGDGRHSLEAFEGKQGILLQAVSASDGKKLAEYKLESLPVFDGLAAANGRLYITLEDGKVVCMDRK